MMLAVSGAGVMLAVEYLNRFETYLLNCAADAVRFIKDVNHPHCRTMYDTFHANIEERDMVGVIGRHAATIGHIHISENDRGIPGRGHIDFPPVFRAIKATGYDDWLTLEAFGRAVPELAAATRVWRDLFPDLPTLVRESIALIRREWARA